MRRLSLILASMALVFAFSISTLESAAPPACRRESPLEKQVVNTSVMLADSLNPNRTIGTGVVLRYKCDRFILTAAHVVPSKAKTMSFEDVAGRKRKAKVVSNSFDLDLAILEPDSTKGLVEARLAKKDIALETGEDCWFCGAAYFPWNLQKGIINRPRHDDRTIFNGGIWYGHSGSGLFVRRGEDYLMVGLVNEMYASFPRAPGRAIPLDVIHKYIEDRYGK